jgi:ABC-type bacteriocin/lantibiotic exporter with double-glycine peptidase domain
MITKHYSKNYRLEGLRDNCFLTREGVSLLDVIEAIEKIRLPHHHRGKIDV